MDEDDVIDFFPGFIWAIPGAFAPALVSYRFEQGDVLYRDRRGYDALSGRIPTGLAAIALRQPPRSARMIPSEYEGDRRLANWQSVVEIDLVDLAAGTTAPRTTTQGRLFMAIWKGGEPGRIGVGEDPPLPLSARDLGQALRDGELVIEPPPGVRRGCRFCFVVDRASDASRAKATTIAHALAAFGPIDCRDHEPIAAGAHADWLFHPTLVVRELILRGASIDAVEGSLRRALYGGGGEEGERFSITRHGVLERLGQSEAQ